MQLSGRPLLDNRVDAALFVDRRNEADLLDRAVQNHLNALVVGDPGAGKTSLLRNLMYRTRTEGQRGPVGDFPMTYVRAEAIDDAEALLHRITESVVAEPSGGDADAMLTQLHAHADRVRGETYARWNRQGNSEIGANLAPVIIVDDVMAAAGHPVFGRLRDELWSLGYVWIVACRTSERGGLLLPPADAFFERVVSLGPMTPLDAVELLRRRDESLAEFAPTGAGRALGGNPRRIIAWARDVLDQPNDIFDVMQAVHLRDTAIAKLGRSEAMLATELEAIGAASASDKELLERLGWTRARAVQVFSRLEAEGLVTSDDVKSGQGRPRKVFRLTAPMDYLDAMHAAEAK